VNTDPLTRHLRNTRYGDFTLTEAVRPALDVPVRPRQGYRTEVFREGILRLHTLTASVSAESLFDVFLDLLAPLGGTLHAVLESSHGEATDRHSDFRRNHIDAAVLASHFCEFEDLLLHDGCTGVAVMSARRPLEVQFDEHKQFTVYAADLRPFRKILRGHGVRRKSRLRFLSEAEHLHHSSDDYSNQFERLALRVGVSDFHPVFSD
jgi:hypothetical protein